MAAAALIVVIVVGAVAAATVSAAIDALDAARASLAINAAHAAREHRVERVGGEFGRIDVELGNVAARQWRRSECVGDALAAALRAATQRLNRGSDLGVPEAAVAAHRRRGRHDSKCAWRGKEHN